MPTTAVLPDLIEDIYAAAIEPALWNKVVVGMRDFVGGQACGLFSKDSISKSGVTHYYCGADPHYIQMYAQTHSKFDPLTVLPAYGEVVSIPDLVNFEEYRKGRFYQEWLQPQGCVDAANVVVEKSNPNCPVLMTVLVGQNMVDEEMRRRISLIIPHANRALMVNRALEAKQSETAGFVETLNGLSAGVFLIDSSCRIVHANVAGRHMLEADDFLREVCGQIVARDPLVNQSLRTVFDTEADVMLAAADRAFPMTGHDGERYVAHVLPLQFLMRNDTASTRAIGALFVRKAELNRQSYGEVVARTFGLTPAELRVLFAIIDVGGVPETAQTLGIAETTVKTHLQRLFVKTGVSRQADLVKIAAGFVSPLAS